MKNTFDRLITRLEERIIELNMTVEITQTEMQRQIRMKTSVNIQALWDSFKRYSLCVI